MIIFPDIHGRDFWIPHINNKNETYIFLGDYVDPYSRENISSETVIENLKKIIEFQQSNPEKVITLAGNHDLTYFLPEHFPLRCRYDIENEEIIKELLCKLNLQIFWTTEIHGKTWIFSHAGLTLGWYKNHLLGTPIPEAIEWINKKFKEDDPSVSRILAEANWYWRGGDYDYGSPVWCDLREFYPASDEYQVFGHTQLNEPVLRTDYACLDCRRAFKIEGGKICGL